MKAILLYEHGPVENLRFETAHPMPGDPGTGRVRVHVHAAALNYLDIWVRRGWPGIKLAYPHIPGADAAGTIDAVGEGVSGWQVGDRVALDPSLSCGVCAYCQSGWQNRCVDFGIRGEDASGTFAEYITVPARNLLGLPEHVSYGEAAAASLVFETAWHSLIPRDVEGGWSRMVYQLTAKRGVDVVVDNVGAATFHDSLRAAGRGGRILTVGNTAGPKFEIDARLVWDKHLTIIGSTMGPHQDYVTVMNLLFKGRLKAVIDATYPLERVQDAMRALEAGQVFGKVVLDV
jgi:NADPH:quinone reductase-like Zn-dependent oxidoreductase